MRPDTPWSEIKARWAYRYQRFMLTPLFRAFAYVLLPIFVCFTIVSVWVTDPARWTVISGKFEEIWTSVKMRPEFLVAELRVEGADHRTSAEVASAANLSFPVSSFDLDLESVRASVVSLAAIKEVRVRIVPGGILEVDVEERSPAAVWVSGDGSYLIDEEGVVIRPLEKGGTAQGLPVVAGYGAPKHIREALEIVSSAEALADPIRGLERIGRRRWDVVLETGLRIQLPQERPVEAVAAVGSQVDLDVLQKANVALVDMRLVRRPTVRVLSPGQENEE